MADSDFSELMTVVGTQQAAAKPPLKYPDFKMTGPGLLLGNTEKEKPGRPVQYSLSGSCYIPTGPTISVLPAGSFRIKEIRLDLGWVYALEPFDLVGDELVEFPGTKSELVVHEVERFWDLKPDFDRYGFTHKRGFLLWGPAGSGKTSTVAIVVQNLVRRGGVAFVASSPVGLLNILGGFRSVEPSRPLVVIWEDLDAVIKHYGETEVLSILDGESQVNNVIFIATTNYPEVLDARIVNRPSRFDRVVKLGLPDAESRSQYFSGKLGTIFAPDGTDLVKATEGMSVGHMREMIVGVYCLKLPVGDVLDRLRRMGTKPKSGEEAGKVGFSLDV
jgi:hypothetical protein